MTEYDTISTETWKVQLPSDWVEQQESDGRLYFESADESKGMYVTTWRIDDGEPLPDVLRSFR
jgi:hypothetical protein